MFCGPSWVDHSCVSLCSSTRRLPNRVALEEDQLFRRLFPTGPDETPKSFSLPAGGDRSFRHPPLPFLPLPAFRWRRGLPSRSPFDNAPRVRVGEAKNSVHKPVDNGDIGNNRRIALSQMRFATREIHCPFSSGPRIALEFGHRVELVHPPNSLGQPGSAPAARSRRDRRASRSARRSGRGRSPRWCRKARCRTSGRNAAAHVPTTHIPSSRPRPSDPRASTSPQATIGAPECRRQSAQWQSAWCIVSVDIS